MTDICSVVHSGCQLPESKELFFYTSTAQATVCGAYSFCMGSVEASSLLLG